MAEEFQTGICGGNWWNMSKSHVLIGGSAGCSSTDMGTYGSWLVTDVVDLKPRSCKLQDSISTNINNNNLVSHDSSVVFQDSQMPQQADSDSGGSSVLMDSTLQIMGFGISSSSPSSSSDWTQTLLRGNGRGESYNSILQEDMNSSALNSSRIQKDWSPKSFTSTGEDSSINGYKAAINQDFTLEQQRLNPLNGSGSCYPSSTTLMQSLFEPDPQPQQSLFNDRTINYSSPQNYGTILNELSPSWPKLSPFLKPSLHFSNNTPFWNASTTAINEIRADFLPSSQPQFLLPAFEEKPNCPNLAPKPNNEQIRDSGSHVVKKGSEPPLKRPRIETPSPLPTFKVRKEKLGDRITALQQLVSPFGKTDTASVLHEAIGCIKFLHDQVNVLSTPYMKNGNPIQHQQAADKLKESEESKQDLKSRGLCLVPISSTFAVANETTADFWTPTFGGTFR